MPGRGIVNVTALGWVQAAALYNALNLQRHLISRRTLRAFRAQARADWHAATAAA